MHARSVFSIALLLLLATSAVFGNEVPSEKYYSFAGPVVAIDSHSITIKVGGKRLVFQINEETKISDRNHHVTLDQITPGDGATVMMKLGKNNAGVAVRIAFDTDRTQSFPTNLFAARTIREGVVSGMAVNNYIAYRPPGDGWIGGAGYESKQHTGVFLMEVHPDGAVYQVKVVQSLGHKELDFHAIDWFKKWRFKPNAVTEVQMPMSYLHSKYPY